MSLGCMIFLGTNLQVQDTDGHLCDMSLNWMCVHLGSIKPFVSSLSEHLEIVKNCVCLGVCVGGGGMIYMQKCLLAC